MFVVRLGQLGYLCCPCLDVNEDAPSRPHVRSVTRSRIVLATSQRRVSLVRRTLRWAGLTFALVVLLAVLLVAALHTPPGRRFVSSQLTRLLAEQHIEFHSQDLGYNLLRLSFSMRHVIVRGSARPDLPAFLTVDRITAD